LTKRTRTPSTQRDRERDPAPIQVVLGEAVARNGWGPQLALGRLKERWPEVVGEQVAARSEPVKLTDGRLTIRVESGPWAAELALLGASLASAVARFLGQDLVQEVAITAAPGRGTKNRP